jgi:hypothetical protein
VGNAVWHAIKGPIRLTASLAANTGRNRPALPIRQQNPPPAGPAMRSAVLQHLLRKVSITGAAARAGRFGGLSSRAAWY